MLSDVIIEHNGEILGCKSWETTAVAESCEDAWRSRHLSRRPNDSGRSETCCFFIVSGHSPWIYIFYHYPSYYHYYLFTLHFWAMLCFSPLSIKIVIKRIYDADLFSCEHENWCLLSLYNRNFRYSLRFIL